MKKALAASIAALLFAGPAGAAPLNVLASFLPIYLFTANVARGAPGVSVDLMLPPSLGCPHDYSLSPADMKKIARADLFVANGMGQEEFLGRPMRAANPRIRVVESAAGIVPIWSGRGPRARPNPHTWVSPRNAILQVRAIEAALAQASPANAAVFRKNADAYAARLGALAAEFEAAARRFQNRRIVTFHDAFDYLAQDAGLSIVARIEETPSQAPSAREVARLIRLVQESGAAAVFAEPQYPARIAETIACEAGVPVRVLDPVATGPAELDTYERIMRANLRTLVAALGGR